MIDFAVVAAQVDRVCPRGARGKGGRPPYSTEVMVRMSFLQALYNLSDEDCEHQVLDRTSFQRFCRLDGIARRAKPGQQARQRLDARNRTINKTRARVEHVFAGLEQLAGKFVRAMTLARNELAITMKCVAYNARRLVWLVSQPHAT